MPIGLPGNLNALYGGEQNYVTNADNMMNAAAQQQAQARMAQINAQFQPQMLQSEMDYKRMMAEAYMQQVLNMNKPKTKAETQKSQAEAGMLEMQNRYPEIMAAAQRASKDSGYWKEFMNREGNENLKNILGDTFDPDVVRAYSNAIMPNNPLKANVADINRNAKLGAAELGYHGALDKQLLANQGALQRQQVANQGHPEQQMTADKLFTLLQAKMAQGIPLTDQEKAVLENLLKFKAAGAVMAPGQTTPKIDLSKLGSNIPTTSPAEERQKQGLSGGGLNYGTPTPQLPQGWTVK